MRERERGNDVSPRRRTALTLVPNWEVVVAQLVERSLPTPEVRGLNPVIGKIYLYDQLYW